MLSQYLYSRYMSETSVVCLKMATDNRTRLWSWSHHHAVHFRSVCTRSLCSLSHGTSTRGRPIHLHKAADRDQRANPSSNAMPERATSPVISCTRHNSTGCITHCLIGRSVFECNKTLFSFTAEVNAISAATRYTAGTPLASCQAVRPFIGWSDCLLPHIPRRTTATRRRRGHCLLLRGRQQRWQACSGHAWGNA